MQNYFRIFDLNNKMIWAVLLFYFELCVVRKVQTMFSVELVNGAKMPIVGLGTWQVQKMFITNDDFLNFTLLKRVLMKN